MKKKKKKKKKQKEKNKKKQKKQRKKPHNLKDPMAHECCFQHQEDVDLIC